MQARHDALAAEMLRRGFNHKSPYEQPDLSGYDLSQHGVDISESFRDLKDRCEECRKQITEQEQGGRHNDNRSTGLH